MESIADWRIESLTAYTNDFELRIVQLASQPGANVAKIARENGVAHNLILNGSAYGRTRDKCHVACRPPLFFLQARSLLPVEIMPESAVLDTASGLCPLNESSCCVEFRHGRIMLENPSPEFLVVLLRELTGRSQ